MALTCRIDQSGSQLTKKEVLPLLLSHQDGTRDSVQEGASGTLSSTPQNTHLLGQNAAD